MYGSVPPIRPSADARADSDETLKSRIIGTPSAVTRTFAGFKSRCRMCRAWSWASPPASWATRWKTPSTNDSRATARSASGVCVEVGSARSRPAVGRAACSASRAAARASVTRPRNGMQIACNRPVSWTE